MKEKTRNVGIDEIKAPKEKCDDKHCPFHGNLGTRGRIFAGIVISPKFHKTVKVEWGRFKFLPKYERYAKARTRVKVHVPPCIDVNVGDKVRLMECRPISKTKNFVILEKIGE